MLALKTATIVDGTGLTKTNAKAENVAGTTLTLAGILPTVITQLVSEQFITRKLLPKTRFNQKTKGFKIF